MKQIDTFYLSEKQIEQLKRKRKFNKKMIKSATLFLLGSATLLSLGFVPALLANYGVTQSVIDSVYNYMIIGGGLSNIIGVCSFAKALHQPLTKNEAQELAERDAIEKRGRSK